MNPELCRKSSTRRAAFTIVELLVVISLIAVLIAMLIPAMQKAKKVTQEVGCRSRMRQVVVVSEIYLSDWAYRVVWQMTNFDPAVNTLTVGAWDLGTQWQGQLMEGNYTDRSEVIHSTNAPSAQEKYWESTLRKKSIFLCPSGRYFGAPGSVSWGAWSSRLWPQGQGAYANDPASVDIVDYHQYHRPYPDWSVKYWGAAAVGKDYGLTITSYNINGNTATTATINGILGYIPLKTPQDKASPARTVFLFESNYHPSRRQLDLDNEFPFTPVVNAPGGNRQFRIPHSDKANYAAMDGSVGVAERRHFGTSSPSTPNDRPFVF